MNITAVFSPALYGFAKHEDPFICIVVDVLRATTTMCTIIEFGGQIIPVASLEEAMDYKNKGFLVAGERIERKLDFADYGNSALNFRNASINGKTIVHTTTNGTQALHLAQTYSPYAVMIGAFSDLNALKDCLVKENKNVEILCSGWKNTFCLEDTLFAGALRELLLKETDIEGNKLFECKDDSAFAAMDLWEKAKDDLQGYLEKASHIHRLRKAHFDDVFDYTFTLNTCKSVPVLKDGKLIRYE